VVDGLVMRASTTTAAAFRNAAEIDCRLERYLERSLAQCNARI
jgi:hypothetical protein